MSADDMPEPVMAEGSYDWWALKVERLEADVQAALAERDQQTERRFEALRERDEARAERDAIAAAAKKALEIRQTHHRTTHPTRLIDNDCLVCQMGLALSRELPGVPDDLDELVRHLDDLNAEEATDV